MTIVILSKGDGSLPEKEITIKLFQNGVFHITGVLNDKYDEDAVKSILKIIQEKCPDGYTAREGVMERRVVLMNYKTKLKSITNIAREKLYNNLRNGGTKVMYEPSVYPAVKVYFENQRWIAKIFRTGNIILTGMTNHGESESLMKQLHPLLEKALPIVSVE
jgi:TATA-box binding protein (TBP) (component of TFIID and TFIIIB)